MRTFTNYDQPFNIKPNITLTISATAINTVYTYGREDIIDISNIDWEMPFTGGLAKTSGYRIKLSNELSVIKDQLPNYINAAVQIKVEVNSNIFYPHVGRIRSYVRDGFDLNQIELEIFDRFFDDNKFFPKELITDSWSTPHPEELLSGYPVYYGKHHRPFYHTAVESDVDILLGPRNVSSENHVNNVYFNSNLLKGSDVNLEHNLLMNKSWQQQSGATNVISGGLFFQLTDSGAGDVKLWKYTGEIQGPIIRDAVNSSGETGVHVNGFLKNGVGIYETITDNFIHYRTKVRKNFSQDVFMTNEIHGSATWQNVTVNSQHEFLIRIFSGSGVAAFFIAQIQVDTTTFIFSHTNLNSFTSVVGKASDIFSAPEAEIWFRRSGTLSDVQTINASIHFLLQLKSEGYTNNSIFSPVINSADLAISENPQLILEDILSNHLSIPFVQEQSSQSQVDVQSYHFQCFFKEREPISDTLNEFGRITQTNMWIGDSGALNFRTFQEDGNETVNNSLSWGSILQRTFSMIEAPVGSSIYDQDLSSKVTVGYNYNFQQALFKNKLIADKFNTAECDSLDSVGISGEKIFETKHVLQADTASLYLGNLVRKYSNANEFVKFSGGAELFPMEIGDVFHMENPIIVGSAANYQIIKLSTNYVKGTTQITGARLK